VADHSALSTQLCKGYKAKLKGLLKAKSFTWLESSRVH